MAPGIPLVAAMTNVIVAVGIGVGGNMTAFQAATGCECVGREGGTAESKRDRKNNNAPTQHELGVHISSFVGGPRHRGAPEEHKANRPIARTAGETRSCEA